MQTHSRFFDFSSRNDSIMFSEQKNDQDFDNEIDDKTYHQIPDKYKVDGKSPFSYENRNHPRLRSSGGNGGNGNRNRSGGPNIPANKASLSNVLVIVFLVLAGCMLYSSFFSNRRTEISWKGFNEQLEQMNIDTVNLKGNQLTGRFVSLPEIRQLPELLPDGEFKFQRMLQESKRTKKLFGLNSGKGQNNESSDNSSEDENLQEHQEYSVETQNNTLKIKLGDRTYDVPVESSVEDEDRSAAVFRGLSRLMLADMVDKNWNAVKSARGDSYELVTKDGKRTGEHIYYKFTCEVPALAFADQELDRKLQAKTNSYTSSTPSDNTNLFMMVSIGVSILLFWLFFRMIRRTNEQMMGGGGFSAFNRSPARRYEPDAQQRITFDDVAGLDNVKSELIEIVDFLKNPAKYERMGARIPKGTLLFGPPGTGKTMLGRAVAGEAGVPFFSINGSEFIQMFVGVGASRVRDLFNAAKENAPAILFIDEIDAVGRLRGAGVGGGQDEREQTLNQILSEMDGFTPSESVMVMASTNRPDVLDPALTRPGRFDRQITVDRPSLKGRIEIFEVYLKKIPKADDVDATQLAKSTVGFTGADIRNIVNEATLWATRNNKNVVDQSDFDFAFEKVVMGLRREDMISDKEKRKTAYHEAGHTIISWFSQLPSKVHKVTIIPRGRSLGATYSIPDEDQVNVNESEIYAMLARYLGGRVAEKMIFNEASAGAEQDLKQATQLARRMVVQWGMSEKLGPVAFRAAESNPFLGREMTSDIREYSESTATLIDSEVVRILRDADHRAEQMLREKHELFVKLAETLIEEEELDEKRLTEILGPIASETGTESETDDSGAENRSGNTAVSPASDNAASNDQLTSGDNTVSGRNNE